MGSRPPLRRTPPRSPPPSTPSPPAPAPAAAPGGKIIRLTNRVGDPSPSHSRADVTPRPPSSGIRPPLSRKRPAPSPPSSSSPSPSSTTAIPRRPSGPPVWIRRQSAPDPSAPVAPPKNPPPRRDEELRPAPGPVPASESIRPLADAETDTAAAKPEAVAEKPEAAAEKTEAAAEKPEATTEKPEAAAEKPEATTEKPQVAEAAEALPVEEAMAEPDPDEEPDAAVKAMVVETERALRASNAWIAEALRGLREDLKNAAEAGGASLAVKLLGAMYTEVMKPAERHVKVVAEIVPSVEAVLERMRKEQEEEVEHMVMDEEEEVDRMREGEDEAVAI